MKSDNKHVFISYMRSNSKVVEKLCQALKNNNINFWLDKENIEPGKFWKDAIKNAINNGAYFIACFSKEYKDKSETYMNEELLEAAEILRMKHYDSGWFIPIKLSECDIPPISLGPGRTLQDIHYLRFYEDWDVELKKMIHIIKRDDNLSVVERLQNSPELLEKFKSLSSFYESLPDHLIDHIRKSGAWDGPLPQTKSDFNAHRSNDENKHNLKNIINLSQTKSNTKPEIKDIQNITKDDDEDDTEADEDYKEDKIDGDEMKADEEDIYNPEGYEKDNDKDAEEDIDDDHDGP